MADPRAELAAREALQQAIQSGDQRAELAAREAIAAAQQRDTSAQSVAEKTRSQTSIPGAAALGAGETILGNIAAIPDVAARGFQGFRGLLAGQPGQALEAVQTQQLPRPSGRDVNAFLAGVEALPGGLLSGAPAEAFQQAQAEQRAESEQAAQQRPLATTVGQAGGDAATLLGLRVPGVAGRAALPAQAAQAVAPAVRSALPNVLRGIGGSKAFQSLARGTGRASEAGIEGAVLGLLDDGDPAFRAGLQAGTQVLGSITNAALRHPIRTATGTALALLAFRDAIPGLDVSFFDALDAGSSKVALAVGIGALTGVPAAAPRLAGRNQAALSAILDDALSALPRGAIPSMIERLARGEGEADVRAAAAVLKAPNGFTNEQLRQFEGAVQSGAVPALLEDRDFAERLAAVEQASPQQLAADNIRRAIETDTRERRLPKATSVAQKIAATLPRNDSRRRRFENAGPRTFIGSLFKGPRPPAELSQLNAADRRDVQEVLLQDMIGSSMARSRGGGPGGRDQVTGIDARQLRTRWLALPAATRESFPARTRDAIEALAGRQIPTIPAPLLAKALMSDGQLVQQLIGDRQQSQRGGLL